LFVSVWSGVGSRRAAKVGLLLAQREKMYFARKAEPSSSRLTTERHQRYTYKLHQKRIRNIKGRIDNSSPPPRKHLTQNVKGKQKMEERYLKIERENQILLDKMSYILRHPTMDNRNESLTYQHSLNQEKRRRQLTTITDQNQSILQRIRGAAPTYDRQEWDRDHESNRRFIANISLYGTDPDSPKFRVIDHGTRKGRRRRPMTAPAGMLPSNSARGLIVDRTLLFTDSKSFADGVWELNVWDQSDGVAIKDTKHIVRISGEQTVTHQKCELLLNFGNVKVLCRESALLSKALSGNDAHEKKFCNLLGGVQALLTMQLGLHLVAKVDIKKKNQSGTFEMKI